MKSKYSNARPELNLPEITAELSTPPTPSSFEVIDFNNSKLFELKILLFENINAPKVKCKIIPTLKN